ncbi:hypothetical protein CTI12_AA081790 [Artemisia annua]|uniref:Ubiquitin-like domain-containing protein n=1 Tax=Artemisia annua TaxID=35608 RepID=A0A2U1Q2M0_ARTAN|nr:hypothetical protein CTI12_AA081790 [Artemisia annua]
MEVFFKKTPASKAIGMELKDSNTFEAFKARLRETLNSIDSTSSLKPGSMQIFVKTHTGKIIPLNVSPRRSIDHVQSLISEHVGVAPLYQGLFFAGIWLEDHRRILSDYNINQDSVLYFVPCFRGNMKIYVETISGKRIPVDVEFGHTAKELKALIQDKEGIRPDQQTLVYAGNKLEENRALCYYYIQNESTIRLLDYTPLMVQIYVEIVATGKTINLEVLSSDSIKNVKVVIQDMEGIPADKQTLFLPQKQLQDGSTLADYCIWNGTTLHLIQNLVCHEGKRRGREYRAVCQEGKRPGQERHPTKPTEARRCLEAAAYPGCKYSVPIPLDKHTIQKDSTLPLVIFW